MRIAKKALAAKLKKNGEMRLSTNKNRKTLSSVYQITWVTILQTRHRLVLF